MDLICIISLNTYNYFIENKYSSIHYPTLLQVIDIKYHSHIDFMIRISLTKENIKNENIKNVLTIVVFKIVLMYKNVRFFFLCSQVYTFARRERERERENSFRLLHLLYISESPFICHKKKR